MKRVCINILFVLLAVAALVFPSVAISASTVYDLQSDWSNTDNPNGVWSYLQGSTILPYQDNRITGGPFGYIEFFAPSSAYGNFLPSWWKDSTTGFVKTHSVTPITATRLWVNQRLPGRVR